MRSGEQGELELTLRTALRIKAILVLLFTCGGIALMLAAIMTLADATELGADRKAYLSVLAALGALIATVGLSASMIVSAIRNPPDQV
jgi:hypothetical protein